MALIFILLALLGFGVFGVASSSTGTGPYTKPKLHHFNARPGWAQGKAAAIAAALQRIRSRYCLNGSVSVQPSFTSDQKSTARRCVT